MGELSVREEASEGEEPEFDLRRGFSELQQSILPIDYLLEHRDAYYMRQILRSSLFAVPECQIELNDALESQNDVQER